jgi:hypothetical protein
MTVIVKRPRPKYSTIQENIQENVALVCGGEATPSLGVQLNA